MSKSIWKAFNGISCNPPPLRGAPYFTTNFHNDKVNVDVHLWTYRPLFGPGENARTAISTIEMLAISCLYELFWLENLDVSELVCRSTDDLRIGPRMNNLSAFKNYFYNPPLVFLSLNVLFNLVSSKLTPDINNIIFI